MWAGRGAGLKAVKPLLTELLHAGGLRALIPGPDPARPDAIITLQIDGHTVVRCSPQAIHDPGMPAKIAAAVTSQSVDLRLIEQWAATGRLLSATAFPLVFVAVAGTGSWSGLLNGTGLGMAGLATTAAHLALQRARPTLLRWALSKAMTDASSHAA